jgi:hypothetical protein
MKDIHSYLGSVTPSNYRLTASNSRVRGALWKALYVQDEWKTTFHYACISSRVTFSLIMSMKCEVERTVLSRGYRRGLGLAVSETVNEIVRWWHFDQSNDLFLIIQILLIKRPVIIRCNSGVITLWVKPMVTRSINAVKGFLEHPWKGFSPKTLFGFPENCYGFFHTPWITFMGFLENLKRVLSTCWEKTHVKH